MYPLLGGVSASEKFNAKNPVDTNAAFRLTFAGGMVYSQAIGIKGNGTNTQANTFWIESAQTPTSASTTIGHFISVTGSAGYDIGVQYAAGWLTLQSSTGVNMRASIQTTGIPIITATTYSQARNFFGITRTNNSQVSFVRAGGGVQTITQNTSAVRAPNQISLLAATGFGGYSDRGLGTAFLGDGLTTTELACLRDAVTTFNTTLGRNVTEPGVTPTPTATSTPTPSNTSTPTPTTTNTPTPSSTPAPIGAWSVGGALITGRQQLAGAGTQNAGLAFGGSNGYPNTAGSCTEEYDGTSWSAGGGLITARETLAGAGEQTAALAFGGGYLLSCTEEYNGTSWSTGGSLITGRIYLGGVGTQNAALAFAGIASPFTIVSCTEEYNGSSWSSGGAIITSRHGLAGAGTQNEALAFGGRAFSPIDISSCTEEYNGSSWSVGGSLSISRYGLAGAGTQNAGLAFGGTNINKCACTEEYNGTSWSVGGALIISRCSLGGAGTQNAGLGFGGSTGSIVNCTEEYSK